jgi:hypothetical protein
LKKELKELLLRILPNISRQGLTWLGGLRLYDLMELYIIGIVEGASVEQGRFYCF